MYFDSTWFIFILPALLISLFAQIRVKSAFSKYSKVPARLTGAQASGAIQRQRQISVPIQAVAGDLTDHFDPKDNVIRLSEPVCNVASVAAVGVAAHETGHALQYAEDYAPLRWRSAIVGVTRIASSVSVWVFIIGMLIASSIENYAVAYLGIAGFAIVFLFQLLTLPVEFNASRRAIRALEDGNMLSDEELKGARKVLSAAALTYVAAMLASLAQVLRLLAIVSNSRGRRR